MFWVALSEALFTWYNVPVCLAYSDLTVLCAATHGVFPAAKISQGPCLMTPGCAARRPIELPAIKPAMVAMAARTLLSLNKNRNMLMIYLIL
jgi:hypothetical protein